MLTKEELIAKARELVRELHDELKDREPRLTHPVDLVNVRVRETVTFYFTGDSQSSSAEVCLDRETGDFVRATIAPPRIDTGSEQTHPKQDDQ